MSSLKEYRLEQLAKLQQLRDLGIEAYPFASQRDCALSKIQAEFQALEGQKVWLTGRLLSLRQHGQITFFDLADASGSLQLILSEKELASAERQKQELKYEDINLLTRGDFLNVYGTIQKSQRGEISLRVEKLKILSKVLRPLPLQLTDIKTRRQRRYLDLAINPSVRERFWRRAAFWRNVRNFLNERGFAEINIPVLEETTGGAEARPFKTHMKALDKDFYLRISHELPLKKLLGGGYEKVYDIGPRFRNENYSDEHLPEHVAMEWYWAYADWRQGMQFMEEMFLYLAEQTFQKTTFKLNGHLVDFKKPWPKLDYQALILEHYDLDVFKLDLVGVKEVLLNKGLEIEKNMNLADGVDRLFKNIRGQIGGPAWLVNTPLFMSPLSKQDKERPEVVQRFQAIIGGSELCNGFSELNDPQEQLQRLEEQQKYREQGLEEAQMLDLDYVEMLEYGMPPACGLGFSERLFWFLEGVPAREGIPFNHHRIEVDASSKEIYPHLLE